MSENQNTTSSQTNRKQQRQNRANQRRANRNNRGQRNHTQNNNPPQGNPSQNGQPGNGTNNPQGGGNPPQNGNTPNNNNPLPQQNSAVPGRTPDFDGQSHAYNLNLPHGVPPKEEKAPKKNNAGDEYKPYKLEWTKFNGDSKKLIMEYLNALFEHIFLVLPLESVTNFTIASIDWFLHAPMSGSSSTPDTKEKPNKTLLNYRDDVRDEYAQKSDANLKLFYQAHKELKDNIDKANRGLPTSWREWGGEPRCFQQFAELARKAEADPNSPEAQRWKIFEQMPKHMKKIFEKEDVLRYFSLTIAAAEVAVNPQQTDIPKNVSKKIDEMATAIKKSTEVATLRTRVTPKINEIRPLLVGGSPLSSEISDALDEIQHILGGQSNDIEKIKKNLLGKIKELKGTNAFPNKIKANSQVYYNSMMENIDKILETYSGNPQRAAEETKKYVNQIYEASTSLEKDMEGYCKEKNSGFKKIRQNKVKKSMERAQRSINEFDLNGMPITQRQQASVRNKNPLLGGKQSMLGIITNFGGQQI